MGQYSEMIGSFIRTSNYPMEANYIFNSEEELKAFYADEINNTTLHKGLLKIVSSEDSLTLYWVVLIGETLQFKPLIQEGSIDKLFDRLALIRNDLNLEISDRKDSIVSILGTNDLSDFQNLLDNLLAISNAVVDLLKLTEEHSDILHEIVGTDEENILEYLKSLDYNNLSDISNLLHKFFNTIDDSDSLINTLPELLEFLRGFDYSHNLYLHLRDLWDEILGNPTPNDKFRTLRGILDFVETLYSISTNRDNNLQTELDLTQIGIGLSLDGSFSPDLETIYLKNATSVMNALKTLDSLVAEALKIKYIPVETNSVSMKINENVTDSSISADVKISNGSDIIVNSDGLYTKLSTEYSNGTLTIKVNDNIRSQHVLAISSIVNNAYYDLDTESLVISFENNQQIVIPVDKLIEEWEVDNPEDTVVELSRERVVAGTDKLSADIRLDSSSDNILKKVGNSLSVDGKSSSITHNGETLSSVLENMQSKDNSLEESILNLETTYDEILGSAGNLNSAISNLASELQAEVTRATGKEDELGGLIANNASSINNINQALEIINGSNTTVGSISYGIADSKKYTDDEISKIKEIIGSDLNVDLENLATKQEVLDKADKTDAFKGLNIYTSTEDDTPNHIAFNRCDDTEYNEYISFMKINGISVANISANAECINVPTNEEFKTLKDNIYTKTQVDNLIKNIDIPNQGITMEEVSSLISTEISKVENNITLINNIISELEWYEEGEDEDEGE